MNPLLWSLGTAAVISILSIIGIFTSMLHKVVLKRLMLLLIAFSAGTLLGETFIHLIPEILEHLNISPFSILLLLGILFYLAFEKILHWHHCHHGHCNVHKYSYASLFGDLVHNFIDGLIIFVSYSVSIPLGLATSFAIIMHEVPQEADDFEILVKSGFTKTTALMFDFLLSFVVVLGILVGNLFSAFSFEQYFLAFAAGGFVYVAFTELLPHLHHNPDSNKTISSFLFFTAGILFMYVISLTI